MNTDMEDYVAMSEGTYRGAYFKVERIADGNWNFTCRMFDEGQILLHQTGNVSTRFIALGMVKSHVDYYYEKAGEQYAREAAMAAGYYEFG